MRFPLTPLPFIADIVDPDRDVYVLTGAIVIALLDLLRIYLGGRNRRDRP